MLDQNTLSQLHKRNYVKYASLIVYNWTIIILTIWSAQKLDSLAFYAFSTFIVASRQHGLFVILHDQVHDRRAHRRWLSDMLINLFCGYPLGINTNRYRAQHIPHHHYPNSDKDPYWHIMNTFHGWNWQQSPKQFIKVLLKDLFGLNPIELFKLVWPWHVFSNHFSSKTTKGIPPLSSTDRYALYFFIGAVVLWLYFFHSWVSLLVWVVSQNCVLSVFMRLRAMGEHPFIKISGNDVLTQIKFTNTIIPRKLESFFITPFDAGYHTVHHIYPSLPTYSLKRAHDLLMKIPDYKNRVVIYDGYLYGSRTIFQAITKTQEQKVWPTKSKAA